MATEIITVKRISHFKKIDSEASFFLMDSEGKCYYYPCNLFKYNPTAEVLALTKEGDSLKLKYIVGDLSENKIVDATFEQLID